MLSLQLPMKFGNVVRVKTSQYLTKITILRRKADREGSYSFATITNSMSTVRLGSIYIAKSATKSDFVGKEACTLIGM